MSDIELLRAKLTESQEWIRRQSEHLRKSYVDFSTGAVETSVDRLKDEEALTARFARLSDILVRRFYRVVAELDDAPSSQVIDVLNHAEKIGVLPSVERMRELRIVRNRIAHEYEEPDAHGIIQRVLEFCPFLLECADLALRYRSRA